MRARVACIAVGVLLSPLVATADSVTVQVTNNQPDGGFTFSPLWTAIHDGSFDAFDAGSAASPGIEALAELASTGTLDGEFAASGASGVTNLLLSPSGPPPFTPGQTNSATYDIGDASVNRFFSYGAMVVPSNDLFIGNDGAMGYELFDAGGTFLGPLTIEIYGSGVWDAGTEVNDAMNGIAFIVGQDAMAGADENGVIHTFFGSPGADDFINSLVGLETPAYTLTDPLTAGELLATITITPEPTSAALFTVIGAIALRLRRR